MNVEDAEDLIFALEFSFGVEILEREAEQMSTVGQLANWLCAILRKRDLAEAEAPDIFELNLQSVADILTEASPKLRNVTRKTNLKRALPRDAAPRQEVWEKLDDNPHHLPLEHLEFLETTAGIFLYSLPFGLTIGAMQTIGKQSALFMWSLIALFAVLCAIMPLLIRRIKRHSWRPQMRTVGELVDYKVMHNYWHLAIKRGSWSEAEMWRVLQKLIASQAEPSIKSDDVQRHTPFSELFNW